MKLLSKLNLFNRLYILESQLDMIMSKLENCHKLCIALARVMNISPKLLKEYAIDEEKLIKYLLEMSKNEKTNR